MPNTVAISAVSTAVKVWREEHDDMSQAALAEAIGVSAATISVLERLPGNIVTPAVYNALITVGLDLKKVVPDVIIEKRRGKDKVFQPNLDIKIPRRKDPLKFLEEGVRCFQIASEMIKRQIAETKSEIAEKKAAVAKLEEAVKQLKEDQKKILTIKEEKINEVVSLI
jgi:DNA-binding XRE family transcriptional regulator